MRTMKMTIGTILLGLIGVAAANTFNPVPSGSNFNYFMGTCGKDVERTAYYSVAVIDGVVTAQIEASNSPGALRYKVTEYKECPTSAELRQAGWPDEQTIAQRTVYSDPPVLAGFRDKAGITALANGWTITHEDTSMNAAIAAYTRWFTEAGLTLDATASNSANIAPYDLTGLASDLRVVFHREGSDVRVFIGAR